MMKSNNKSGNTTLLWTSLKIGTAVMCGISIIYLLGRKRNNNGDDHKKRESQVSQLDAVGGHGSKKDKGPPILARDNVILKPFQPAQKGKAKSRGELEAEFYDNVTKGNHPIKDFIPAYHGLEEIDGSMYLKMENLTYGLKEPCVLDLKMGQRTYGENASPEKIARERSKYPPQEEIGFRIVGMKVYRPSSGETWKSDRSWCMSLTAETMPNAIEQFFFDGRVVRFKLVEQLKAKLIEISNMLRDHPTWRMYGSSLLIVYDGAANTPPKILVKMIDFAHIFEIKEKGGVDDGYLHGLNFLRMCLDLTLSRTKSGGVQVGGAHANILASGGEIVKQEDKAEQFDMEVAFYEKAWSTSDALTRFMPKLIRVDENAKPRQLVISDASCLVKDASAEDSVSVMDIKLGIRSFRSDCPNKPKDHYFSKYAAFEQELSPGRAEEIWEHLVGNKFGPKSLKDGKLGKRDYLNFRDATTTSTELGFRLTALVHGDYKVSQNDSRSIETRIQFLDRLEHFLSSGKGFDVNIASMYVLQLNQILQSINDSAMFSKYEMVGTSLLFLHANGKAAIRWIDFANSQQADTVDHNGITEGIHRLCMAIEELILKYQH